VTSVPTSQPSKPAAAAERVVSAQNAAPAQGPAKPPTLAQPLSQPTMRDAQQSRVQGPQAPPQLRSQNITSPIPDKAPQLPSPMPQKAPYGYQQQQQRQPQQDLSFRGPPSQGAPPQQYQAAAPQKYQAPQSQQYQAPPPQQFQAPAPQYQAAAAQAAMQNGNYAGSYNKSGYNSQPQQQQQPQSQHPRNGTNGTYASQERQAAPQPQPRSVAPPARRVFGQSLDTLFRRDELPVPLVVSQCIQAVDLFGLQVEGIYRTSGNQAHINQLKQVFDTGKFQKS